MMALLRHLPRDSVSPEVVALDEGSDRDMLAELDALGIPLVQLPAGGAFGRYSALKRILRERGYSAVLSCGIRADFLNLVACPPAIRGVIKQEPAFTPFGGRLKTLGIRVMHLGMISSARRIVSVSRHVHDSLPALTRRASVVIGNAVDLDHFRPPTEAERAEARHALGVSGDQEVLVFAGTLDGRKRPHLLLPAIDALNQEGRSVMLLVAGDGPMRSEMEKAGRHSPVKVVGFQEDVRSVFWAGDGFALPSTHEGLPLAAMEALACGLPLLLSGIAPHVELLEGAEAAGEVTDVTDEAGLSRALARVLDRAGTPGPRTLAEQRFGAPGMAASYNELITSWPS